MLICHRGVLNKLCAHLSRQPAANGTIRQNHWSCCGLTVYASRCPMPPLSAAAAITSASASVSSATWTCTACTYVNTAGSKSWCGMCQAPRDESAVLAAVGAAAAAADLPVIDFADAEDQEEERGANRQASLQGSDSSGHVAVEQSRVFLELQGCPAYPGFEGLYECTNQAEVARAQQASCAVWKHCDASDMIVIRQVGDQWVCSDGSCSLCIPLEFDGCIPVSSPSDPISLLCCCFACPGADMAATLSARVLATARLVSVRIDSYLTKKRYLRTKQNRQDQRMQQMKIKTAETVRMSCSFFMGNAMRFLLHEFLTPILRFSS
jgi:hypothetical protein